MSDGTVVNKRAGEAAFHMLKMNSATPERRRGRC